MTGWKIQGEIKTNSFQINDSKENLSYIIIRMNLIQYKKLKTLALCLGRVLLKQILSLKCRRCIKDVKICDLQGRRKSIIGRGGADIHIFMFTDCKNNRFQIKEINDAEHEYMNICPPQLSTFRRPWICRCKQSEDYVWNSPGTLVIKYLFLFIDSLYWLPSSRVARAVASMYSWGRGGGGVGQKFPNDEKNFRIFHGIAYEATKVFAIRKMKTQFTKKNTHILRTDILRSLQCRKKLFFRVSEMPFPGLWGEVLTEFWWSDWTAF